MLKIAATLRLAFVLVILLVLGISAGARMVHSSQFEATDRCQGYGIC